MTSDFGKAKSHGRQVFYQGAIGEFAEEALELPNGRRMQLALLRHPGAAAVVPFIDAQTVLLIRQYRYAAGGTIWEVPAGKLDPGEAPEVCAVRELKEETGWEAQRVTRLGKIHTTPGFTDEVIHLYAAHDMVKGAQELDPDEIIDVKQVPLAEALAMVERGEITDAKTACALLYAERLVK